MTTSTQHPADPPWDQTVDFLVAGSGAGGLSASLFAAKQGAKVLLCEKADVLGGTTATSGGVLWIPNNPQARQQRLDSGDRARAYLHQELGEHYQDELIDAFLEHGSAALEFLDRHTELKFDMTAWPDYHPAQPDGLEKGRSLMTRPFDARQLGSDFRLVRAPVHRLMVLGGMMVRADEIPDFLNPFRSFAAFRRVTRKVLRHIGDRLRYSRGTEVLYGNALVARALYSLRATDAQIWLRSPLRSLIRQDGRVVGAVVSRDGRDLRVRARKGVVLATGGFPHNRELRAQYFQQFPHEYSGAYEGNVGDGLLAAQAVGAAVDTDLRSPGLWSPASSLKAADGSDTMVMYGYLDRGRPGCIAVDRDGQRFVNESNSYHDIVMAMFNQQRGKEGFYFVCDARFVRKYGMGAIRPYPFTLSLKPFVKSGYIHESDSIAGLATQIGVDPAALVATLERYNGFTRTGIDPEFQRGENAYNWQYADAKEYPNANLAPIEQGPYYALKIEPATLGTTAGLKADGDARVLDDSGRPVPGLYACGNERASVLRGYYPGGGSTLGPAITFAYAAVKHALAAEAATAGAAGRQEPAATVAQAA